MARKNIVAGIDLGDHEIKIAVAETKSDRQYPRLLALVKKESSGFRRGHVYDIHDAQEAVTDAMFEAEKTAGVKVKNVYVAVGGAPIHSQTTDGSVLVSRADSEITENDLNRALAAGEAKLADSQNNEVITAIPISYKIEGKKVNRNPLKMKAGKLEGKFLFITSLAHHVDDLYTTLEYAGVKVAGIIPASLAASTVCLSKQQQIAGCVLADIGAGNTNIAVFEEGIVQSVETLDIGSVDITSDIALGLKIPLPEAEQIKVEWHGRTFSEKQLREIVDPRLTDIFELIDKHLIKLGKSELLPAGIVICGGGAFIPKIETIAQQTLNLPASIATPLMPQNVKLPPLSDSGEDRSRIYIKDPTYAVSYGLCVWAHNPPRLYAQLSKKSGLGEPITAGISRFLGNFLP